MGSIDTILASLKKISDDKKSQISTRYDEEATWLAGELNLIRQLILKHASSEQCLSNDTLKGQAIVPSSSTSSSDKASEFVGADAVRNKRKSPEFAENSQRFSPLPKKNSSNLFVGNLTAELNKLRKDQLLEELDKYGYKSSMRALKKDLVDTLRDFILASKNEVKMEKIEINSETSMMSPVKPVVSQIANEAPKSARKNSLLDEIRVLVASDPSKQSNDPEDQSKTESEFAARQKRHRDSQIRSSMSQEIVPERVVSEQQLNAEQGNSNDMIQSPFKTSNVEGVINSPVVSAWMDVASPQKVLEPKPIESDCTVETVEDLVAEEIIVPVKETRLSAGSDMSSASVSSLQSSTSSKSNNAGVPPKKLSNLMSSQTSFLDKPQPAKPPIQSLVLAKQAKITEEKKAQAKKLEQEMKLSQSSKMANSQGLSLQKPTPNMQQVKPVSIKTAEQVKSTVHQQLPQPPAPVKKPGMFTALLNKIKPNIETKPFASASSKVQEPTSDVSPPIISSVPLKPATIQTSSQPKQEEVKSPVASNQQIQSFPKAELMNPQSPRDENSNPNDNYELDDDDSSDGSGTDDDADEGKEKEKSIPEWARGPKLKEALERQLGIDGSTPMDPDLIFHEVQTCNLEEIFGSKKGIHDRWYSRRTSSAHWEPDSLTLVEKRTYRNQMGYNTQLY